MSDWWGVVVSLPASIALCWVLGTLRWRHEFGVWYWRWPWGGKGLDR